MNIWNQSYPKCIADLIKQCNEANDLLYKKLNDSSCKTLSELYQPNHNGTIKKDIELFELMG
jgi:hypothetical protein